MIEFVLDSRSQVATYMQLVLQVKQALRVGLLRSGDQLPRVRDVAQQLAINPNTVLKAYRELRLEGLTEGGPAAAPSWSARWPTRRWATRRSCAPNSWTGSARRAPPGSAPRTSRP